MNALERLTQAAVEDTAEFSREQVVQEFVLCVGALTEVKDYLEGAYNGDGSDARFIAASMMLYDEVLLSLGIEEPEAHAGRVLVAQNFINRFGALAAGEGAMTAQAAMSGDAQ